MTIQKFRTNLNCGNCVAAVKPHLDNDPLIRSWSVDTGDPRKVLVVEGDGITAAQIARYVADAGFKILDTIAPTVPAAGTGSFITTYKPVLLVLVYLLAIVGAVEAAAGRFDIMRAMTNFMGGFFIAFSFFKLLDLRGFVDAFQSYDILAGPVRPYGFAYPFLELALGLAYVTQFAPMTVSAVTAIVMALGLVGVTRALVLRRSIRCACLGTIFNLPMSTVALVEDALMLLMAVAMLVTMP